MADMMPSTPALGAPLRLATFADLSRVAVISAAAHHESNYGAYWRPYGSAYPQDTLAYFHKKFRDAIFHPDKVAIVVEDEYDPREAEHVLPALASIYPSFEEQFPASRAKEGRVVVGLALLVLPPGSKRHGLYQPEDPGQDVPPIETPNRDIDSRAMMHHIMTFKKELCEARYEPDNVAVHPAYWRRGHATTMGKWMLAVAAEDGVESAIGATNMGAPTCRKLGFREERMISAPGYEGHPEPFVAWFGLWKPEQGHAL